VSRGHVAEGREQTYIARLRGVSKIEARRRVARCVGNGIRYCQLTRVVVFIMCAVL
jgi:hypothetical protein